MNGNKQIDSNVGGRAPFLVIFFSGFYEFKKKVRANIVTYEFCERGTTNTRCVLCMLIN